MKFNLKEQIRNKYFWISVASLIVLTAQQFDLNIIPDGFQEYINTILTVLVGMGILNNNMTNGLGE